jgi:hypothetical protein
MFRMEKAKLDMEVAKWDDSGNDIIVMAKQMCMIMMEMTDFTRYYITIYHIHVTLLRLRKNGIARPCIYFDETSFVLYKYGFKIGKMLALFCRRIIETWFFFTENVPYFWYVINRLLNLCKFITKFIELVE